MTTIEHWIDGAPAAGVSTRRGPVWDPATGRRQAEVRLADAADVDTAVAAASGAFASWRHSSLTTRSRVMFAFRELLRRHETDLARLVTAEHGKVLDDARGEVVRGREVVEYACGIAEVLKGSFSAEASGGVDVHSLRQPLGVCAGVTPFNFPVMVPLWMHPIAIACGNAFVLKPSERDPSVSRLVAELYAEAGLPEGVFNVVNGDRATVDALLAHPDVAAVSFVGSTDVARHVHRTATANGKRVQALGGAKNHAVVLPDADPDFAAEQLVAAAFGSAGQRCMAVSVAVAVGEAAEALVPALREHAAAIRLGPGSHPDSQMGPVVTAQARDRVAGYVASGLKQGATAVTDGRDAVVAGCESGFFIGPTVLDHVTDDMDVYRDEVFGPVLAVVRVSSLDEAIAVVNRNRFGNGVAVFTGDGAAAREFERRVEVGMVGVNVPIPVPMAYYSFGGWRDSLFGDTHIHGPEGVRFHTRAKVVTSRWPRHESATAAHLNFPTAG